MILRESIPGQVDSKSRVPEEKRDLGLPKRRVWNSQGGGMDKRFLLHSLVKISWTEEHGGLQSTWDCEESAILSG